MIGEFHGALTFSGSQGGITKQLLKGGVESDGTASHPKFSPSAGGGHYCAPFLDKTQRPVPLS